MRAKSLLHFLIAMLVTFPVALGGAIQAQSSTSAPASCTGKASFPAGASNQTIQSGGMTRSYILYMPRGYDPTQPTPLVFSLHGFSSNAREQEGYSRWDQVAESENILVVYPNGTGSPQRWNSGQRELPAALLSQRRGLLQQFLSGFFQTMQVDDVAFFHDLIGHLSNQFCVDSARIYVNGISNGGGMTNRLACQLSDQIAAAGMVEGAYTDFPGGCNPTRPVPVVAFHAITDPIVPYYGAPMIGFPPIETWVSDWAARDQCAPTAMPIAGTKGDVSGKSYTHCAANAEVDFYTISDGGHTWPGGPSVLTFILGKTSQDIDATQTMWAFFKAHPMPGSSNGN